MHIFELINSASKKLKSKNISSYRLDSEILISKVLGKKREEILINDHQAVKQTEIEEFSNLIERRLLKEPIAYITGEKEFWSKSFEVNRSTLIPRPETELLIEKLIEIYKYKNIDILDVGTGTGCILISLLSELKNSFGVGIDISKSALKIANQNAKKNEVINRAKFILK